MEPSERRRLVLLVIEALLTIAVAWVLDPGRPPLRPWFWHAVMRGAQGGAYKLGQLGMRAELHYRQDITA